MYGGEVELKMMSEMGYDASTIGNHDFDNGMEGLVRQLPNANFPFLCANYDFSDTPLNNKTQPYKIFEKGGIRTGVFGLGIELQGLVDKKLYGNTVYNDPVVKAAYYAQLLKEEKKCDLVICLSHLGYKYKEEKISDELLAKQSRNIDLILGGHTHTFLDEPVRYKNRDGKEIIVAQVGWAGIKLGRIDYYFEKNSKKKDAVATTLKISRKSIAI
jgi:5'-nucleotidase